MEKSREKGKCIVEEQHMDAKEWEELCNKMEELREKENRRMIEQNEEERKREEEESCFEAALRGSKIYRKELERQINN